MKSKLRSYCQVITLLVLSAVGSSLTSCGDHDSNADPNRARSETVKIEARPDGEAILELGDVDDDAEDSFGCHIWVDLSPFSFDETTVDSGKLFAHRMMLPVSWDLEKLDGAVFHHGHPGFTVGKIGTLHGDAKIPITLKEISFARNDNFHFRMNLHGQIGNEQRITITADLAIQFTHFAPEGFPNEEIIERAKELIGDTELPSSRVLKCNSVTRIQGNSTTQMEEELIALILHENLFETWHASIRSEVEFVELPPEDIGPENPPSWWIDTGRDDFEFCETAKDVDESTWLSVSPEARGLYFHTRSIKTRQPGESIEVDDPFE